MWCKYMLEVLEIIKLMVELSEDSFQESIDNLRADKNLSKEFVELLINFTIEERDKKIRQSLIA